MKKLLLKYGPFLVFAVLIGLLAFVLLPAEEKHYFRNEQREIQHTSRKALLVFLAVIFVVLICVVIFRYKAKFPDFLVSLLGLLVFMLSLYLALSTFFEYGVYFANRVFAKGQSEKQYMVVNPLSPGPIKSLYDPETRKTEHFSDPFTKSDEELFKDNDTVLVSFKTGLFRYRYVTEINKP